MPKRVLIITYYWPPTGGSGVQRWVKFTKYLPDEGWEPVIYTPENPEAITTDNSLVSDIPEGTEIIKTRIIEPYNLYRKITGKTGEGKGGAEVNPINSQKKSPGQQISMWIRGNFFIPDPRCMWIGPSVRFLKKYLKEHPVDVIVSTGPPHSMHLIAEKVADSTGIPWVADFRDPWTKMFYFKHLSLCSWAKKRHTQLEKRVLDKADAVVAVSPLVKEDFEAMTNTPVTLITNGFDKVDFESETETDGRFRITHTGLFASDGNPEILWEVLASKCMEDEEFKNNLNIRLAGKTDREILDSIRLAGLGENLSNLGYKDHKDAVKEQISASVLILPLRKEPEYKATLPGKLFEYLASGRPVLGIGQTDGAMARILGETKAGFVFDWNDRESVRKYVNFCWKSFKNGTLKAETDNIEKYSRKSLAHSMACLFNSLTNRHKQ